MYRPASLVRGIFFTAAPMDESPTDAGSAIANTADLRSSVSHIARAPIKPPSVSTTSTRALSFSRSSKSQGFGLSVLLIFGYYILSFFSSSLGVKGILNPFLAAWGPVFLSITVALLLIKRASKI